MIRALLNDSGLYSIFFFASIDLFFFNKWEVADQIKSVDLSFVNIWSFQEVE